MFNTYPRTFYIQWHITNHCHLRCRHCYQEIFSPQEDLDWPGLKRIADNFLGSLREKNQVACINLTGGEPFLKPELWPLIEYLSQQPEVIELGIITNGLLLNEEMAARISLYPKINQLKVSLDGPDPKTNDSLRGSGVWQKVVKNLINFEKAASLPIYIMFTIMQRNFQTIPSLVELARELKVRGLILERFIPWGRGKELFREVLNKEQWREFLQMLSSLMAMAEKDIPGPYQAFQIKFQNEEPMLLGAPCVLGEDGFCIMPDGQVYPCRRFPIPIGHLRDESLHQIWNNSSLLRDLRRKENLQGKCRLCPLKNCRGCRSLALALTGNYFAADPHCPYTF
ncbi:MAG: radical SAM protein [Thermodesulfobacteriota bacterium]